MIDMKSIYFSESSIKIAKLHEQLYNLYTTNNINWYFSPNYAMMCTKCFVATSEHLQIDMDEKWT